MSEHKYAFNYVIDPRKLISLHVAVELLIVRLEEQIKKEELSDNSYFSKYKKELEQLLIDTDYSNLKYANTTNVN
jgi:hypothetical protein